MIQFWILLKILPSIDCLTSTWIEPVSLATSMFTLLVHLYCKLFLLRPPGNALVTFASMVSEKVKTYLLQVRLLAAMLKMLVRCGSTLYSAA